MCKYQHWSKTKKALVPCGRKVMPGTWLCPFHHAFVKDSTEGPFTKSKRPHPADRSAVQWVHLAWRAWSKPIRWLPESAGKPDGLKKGERIPEVEAWNSRRLEQIRGTQNLPAIRVPVPACVLALRKALFDLQWFAEPVPLIALPSPKVPLALPAPVAVWSRERIERACRKVMERKDEYRGKGISPIVWSIGFRLVYQNRPASDAQIEAVAKIAKARLEKYAPILDAE